MGILQFILICLVLFDFCENSNGYITREIGGEIRYCVPISNCPPGHTIVPCIDKFTNDTCRRCSEGLVQPDYIQSTKDPSLTECFKNQNVDKCRAYDVEPSREKGASGCGSGGEFCKCDTDQCLFGDPCACQRRKCGMDETMLTDGRCIKCPPETRKNDSKCGPCFDYKVTVVRFVFFKEIIKKILTF
ncbi:uncharacterized protein LOC134692232 [Mytilus trossulus]|uniref:uncharacterized protein LOC134692232 n=1 Tax=Mytilus trossulus TaxID=6551 RepID=UPI003007C731